MVELPERRIVVKPITIKKDYTYKEVIQGNIPLDTMNAIVFSSDDLSCDMSTLINFCNISSTFQLKNKD